MDTAAKILVIGGMANMLYGFVTGLFFARERETKEHAHRYLVMAHVGPLMQGTMLLALVFGVELSDLSAGTETFAASLLVLFSFAIAAKDTINWMQGVNDEFRERPPVPKALGLVGVPLGLIGLAILAFGVLRAL